MSDTVKLTKPQRSLLRAMAGGSCLSASISGGYPFLDNGDFVKQQTVAACERRGWVARGGMISGTPFAPEFAFYITAAGRSALAEDGRS
jgi:hypothetical protein